MTDSICSFVGVVLVSLADSSYPRTGTGDKPADLLPPLPNPPLGDSLALISALFYALYVSLLKVRIRDESRVNMQLFFGFVGLFNVVTLWPLGLVVHFLGVEPFELPQNWKEWLGIGINVSLCESLLYPSLILPSRCL
jgi:solute carrier family 35 protein F5